MTLCQGDNPGSKRVRAKRATGLQRCRFCEREQVPGHMHSADVCQSCGEQQLGVVY